jgi:hypothetical protein
MDYALTLTQVVEIINKIKQCNDFNMLTIIWVKCALTLTFLAIFCQEKNDRHVTYTKEAPRSEGGASGK